jgi:hypothetical protein
MIKLIISVYIIIDKNIVNKYNFEDNVKKIRSLVFHIIFTIQ